MPRRSELRELPPARKAQRGLPWEEMADGEIWELHHPDDFKGKPEGVEARARERAKKMGRTVETRVVEQGRNKTPMVLVQFGPPRGDESGDARGKTDADGNWN